MENQGLGSWIYRRRIKSRDKVALIFREDQLTYGELNERVNRLANAFLAHGISRGDRIAYLGENHPSFVEVFFAARQIGALFVPLNTRLAAPELHYALEDSGSRVLVHSEELAEVAEKAAIGIDKLRLVIVGDAAMRLDLGQACGIGGARLLLRGLRRDETRLGHHGQVTRTR